MSRVLAKRSSVKNMPETTARAQRIKTKVISKSELRGIAMKQVPAREVGPKRNAMRDLSKNFSEGV
jgi:hypothetical protein